MNKNFSNSFVILKRIHFHLNTKRKAQLVLACFSMIFSGISEIFTLTAVLPFVSIISNNSVNLNIPIINYFLKRIDFSSSSNFLIPVTLIFSIAILFSVTIRLINLWFISKVAAGIGSDLGCKVYTHTLYQPYQYHLSTNSSKFLATLTNHTRSTVDALNFTLQLITSLFVSLCILITIFIVDWKLAISLMLIFCSAYFLISITIRRRLSINSKSIARKTNQQIQVLQEGLGDIRHVIISNSYKSFINSYRHLDSSLWQLRATNNFLSVFPRFAIEGLALLLMVFISLFLSVNNSNSIGTIPLLGTFALAAQRLLPAMQSIFIGWSRLKSVSSEVNELIDQLDNPIKLNLLDNYYPPLPFNNIIKLENVNFSYADNNIPVLKDISLSIQKGDRVGIMGSTGSGKSTLVDILLGLLIPDKGKILIDDVNITRHTKNEHSLLKWQASLSYVPQDIYLSDKSFVNNIAYGIQNPDINREMVIKAAKNAHIYDFIKSSKYGFDTIVGERGVKLSGGQKQRIAIARALYQQKNIIFFDEATSALDINTESSVINSIFELDYHITIVMIAHRLTTLKRCNKIVHLEEGTVKNIIDNKDLIQSLFINN